MKRKHISLLSVFLMGQLYCYAQDLPIKFDWLIGNWVAKTKPGFVYENWIKTNATAWEAIGGELSGKDTIFKEKIILRSEIEKDTVFYIAKVGKQPPVPFILLEDGEYRKYTFENKQHDFPQWITFEYVDSLNFKAIVQEKIKGKNRKEEYLMKKIK